LRPAKPLPSGKRVTCPKCGAGFVVRGEDDEAETQAKAAKKPGAPAGKGKDDPFADEGPEMYAVIKEEQPVQEEDEEEEDYDDEDEDRPRKKKPKKEDARLEDLEFRLNTSITDPRGPAQAALISPSNFLMLMGFITIVAALLTLAYGSYFFLFTENLGLEPKDVLSQAKKKDGEESKGGGGNISIPDDQDPKKLQGEQANRYWAAYDAWMSQLIIIIIASVIVIGYNTFIIIGGVKMQNMESYTWAMVATIMAFVPLCFPGLGQIAALMSLTALRSKKVIDGFTYVPPSATPHARQKREVL
jgi:hypothetical protein